jgi:hypothetical protein
VRWFACLIAIATFVASQPLAAWWITGHTVINRTAVETLPDGVPDYLRRQIDWIGARSTAPDSWRDAAEPSLQSIEIPNHYWYFENIPTRPRPLPPSRHEFIVLVHDTTPRRAGGVTAQLRNVGTLPYAIIETYERLKAAFRGWRELRDRDQDASAVEADAAFYVGWLGHYIGDGAMPLHTSTHHNGWVGDNPKGYARDRDIHARFESDFVDRMELTEQDIRGRIAAPQLFADPFAAVLQYLERSHTRVEQVYQLDQQKAYADGRHPAARELVYVCTADAATMLRDLIYSAWQASGL